jgi:hypothetical protein
MNLSELTSKWFKGFKTKVSFDPKAKICEIKSVCKTVSDCKIVVVRLWQETPGKYFWGGYLGLWKNLADPYFCVLLYFYDQVFKIFIGGTFGAPLRLPWVHQWILNYRQSLDSIWLLTLGPVSNFGQPLVFAHGALIWSYQFTSVQLI